ncbi:YbhB/YbcL family Raf kinase inhibitor-like protein [Curtobacterium sp. ISL-83]|nr:YbhB/YbcL family Raf kinase inhibitor-like protein [Curtobacterium sp. ISL-83]
MSPPLSWTPPPSGTVELVLVVQDPDVPMKRPATHALVVGVRPTLTSIPEGALSEPSPVPGLRNGNGTLGRRGYSGPLPPRSHGPHSYVFQLFALDAPMELPDRYTLRQALDEMTGHVLARARLDGTYERR